MHDKGPGTSGSGEASAATRTACGTLLVRERLRQRAVEGMLVANNLVRRATGAPGRGPFGTRAVLEAAQADPDLAHLRDVRIATRHHDRQISAPPETHPDMTDLVDPIAGTGINSLFLLGHRPKHPLILHVWRGVFFAVHDSRWTIFGADWVDRQSTALPSARALACARAGEAEPLDCLSFCGDVFSPNNPGHFINDQIPRGLQFRDWLGKSPESIALPPSTARACILARDILLPGCTLVQEDRLYRCRELALLSSVCEHGHPMWFLDPRIVAGVTGPLRAAAAGMPSVGRAVYLSRMKDARRKLRDEAGLAASLEGRGVQILSMGDLDGEAQFGAVHGADLVIAPHGGALGTLAAARPGTRVLELFSPHLGTLCYAGVARASGLDYSLMIGEPETEDGQPHDGWRISHDAVLHRVDALLSS